jgi:hypothetical protein
VEKGELEQFWELEQLFRGRRGVKAMLGVRAIIFLGSTGVRAILRVRAGPVFGQGVRAWGAGVTGASSASPF